MIIGRTVSALGLSILYEYVFREYCLQLIMYSVSAQGVVERIINVLYYYYCCFDIALQCVFLCADVCGPGHNNLTPSIPEEPEEPRPKPPPLPPRRRHKESLSSELGVVMRSSEPPPPPPRQDSTVPPPVPPRRDSMPVMSVGLSTSLPRSQSVSNARPVSHSHVNVVHGNTLPRHNSERHNSLAEPGSGLSYSSSSSSSVFDVNGEEGIERPVLPPRTYKSHSRKQSS